MEESIRAVFKKYRDWSCIYQNRKETMNERLIFSKIRGVFKQYRNWSNIYLDRNKQCIKHKFLSKYFQFNTTIPVSFFIGRSISESHLFLSPGRKWYKNTKRFGNQLRCIVTRHYNMSKKKIKRISTNIRGNIPSQHLKVTKFHAFSYSDRRPIIWNQKKETICPYEMKSK